MRLPYISIVVLFSICLLTADAYADLDNAIYAMAREQYVKGDCNEALPLLRKYRSEDDNFLKTNPNILSAIKDAMDYCQYLVVPKLIRNHVSPCATPKTRLAWK